MAKDKLDPLSYADVDPQSPERFAVRPEPLPSSEPKPDAAATERTASSTLYRLKKALQHKGVTWQEGAELALTADEAQQFGEDVEAVK